jgi:hypothetical protein
MYLMRASSVLNLMRVRRVVVVCSPSFEKIDVSNYVLRRVQLLGLGRYMLEGRMVSVDCCMTPSMDIAGQVLQIGADGKKLAVIKPYMVPFSAKLNTPNGSKTPHAQRRLQNRNHNKT